MGKSEKTGLGRALVKHHNQMVQQSKEKGHFYRSQHRKVLESYTEISDIDAILEAIPDHDEDEDEDDNLLRPSSAAASASPNLPIKLDASPTDGLTPEEARKLREMEEKAHRGSLRVPRRPPWHTGMSVEELDANERQAFLAWRRVLAGLEENDNLILTSFEKNLDIWRQLWRVLERSDLLVMVVDARDPLFYRCPDLETALKVLQDVQQCFGRPIGVSEDDGCKIVRDDEENASLDIGESLSLPISVIDSEKCQRLTETVWIRMLEKERQKGSFVIDLLCEEQCKQLGVLGALPVNTVDAGYNAPEEIIAVFRPASYNSSDSRDIINQSDILKMDLLMSMEVEYESEVTNSKTTNIYSTQLAPSEHQGYHGLYVYQLRRNIPCLFQKAGIYTFSFLSNNPKCTNCKKRIVVRASSEVKMWKILFSEQIEDLRVSVGSSFPPLSIGGFDAYENRISFVSAPDVKVELLGDDNVLFQEEKVKPVLLSDGLIVQVKDFLIKAHNLDTIRPNYKATLVILPGDGLVSLLLPCQVFPGSVKRVKAQGSSQRLLPNSVMKELNLEVFDSYGNHAKEGTEVQLVVDGFCFVGKATSEFKVDENGCIDISQQLKVTAGYGEVASISLLFRDKEVFRQEYHIEISSPQQDEKLLLVHNPPTQEISYPEQDEKPLLPHNLLPQEIVQNMVKLFMDIHKDRERDMLMCGKEVGDCERELEALRNRRAEIKESLASLQATLGSVNLNCPVTEEEVLESIKDQIHSAASLVCYLSRDFTFCGPQVSFVDDIVGVVALLGTVCTSEQSRILSSYLDKDHMLAVVCRSSDAASALEKYDENGDIDLELGLHAEAAVLDTRIHHQFLVICLDNIRPYKGKVASDSQRKLLLPVPVLGNGKIPAGFMGHAVNMIKINDRHLETRTAEGFGLRETLFYRLFGDLQVYETRNHMRAAQSCIREGAVSLDGGMIRGNGIASLGCRSCDVRFRVTELSYGQPIPPEWLEAKMQYEREKMEIEQVEAAIEKCTRRHEKIMKRFQQSTESCYKLTSIVPCGRNFGLS